nr:MAG TPA: hypothetical protein [Caudoviricetes sp.]
MSNEDLVNVCWNTFLVAAVLISLYVFLTLGQ